MSQTIIAPSVLAADFRNLERAFDRINNSEASWIHFDVMDGLFVPNISFGFPLLEAVRSLTDKFIDVHLMIENPNRYLDQFVKSGANHISIHFEKNDQLRADLESIRSMNCSCGLVINPDTAFEDILEFLPIVDVLLIMSVHPGFGGQSFIPNSIDKVKQAAAFRSKENLNYKIEVDGGVSIANSKDLIIAGADILVSGSALFKASSFDSYITQLKSLS
jgi:ribulose-phosphate 3-epimerase